MSMFDPPLQIPRPIKPTPVQLRPADNRISANEDPSEKPAGLMCFSADPMDEIRDILFACEQQQQPSHITSQQQPPNMTMVMSRCHNKPPLHISMRASIDGMAFLPPTPDNNNNAFLPIITPPPTHHQHSQLVNTSNDATAMMSSSCEEGGFPAAPGGDPSSSSSFFEFDLPQMPAVSPTPGQWGTTSSSISQEEEEEQQRRSAMAAAMAPQRCGNPLTRNNNFMSDYYNNNTTTTTVVIPARTVQTPTKGATDIYGAELGLFDLSPPTHQLRSMRI